MTVTPAPVSVLSLPLDSKEPEGEIVETTVIDVSPYGDDGDSPQWPDAAAETAFLSEQRTGGETAVLAMPASPRESEAETEPAELANLPLPPLQSLIDRIPSDAREVLEELFRARFVSVKRVQRGSFK